MYTARGVNMFVKSIPMCYIIKCSNTSFKYNICVRGVWIAGILKSVRKTRQLARPKTAYRFKNSISSVGIEKIKEEKLC